jgi:hypothetical protein
MVHQIFFWPSFPQSLSDFCSKLSSPFLLMDFPFAVNKKVFPAGGVVLIFFTNQVVVM